MLILKFLLKGQGQCSWPFGWCMRMDFCYAVKGTVSCAECDENSWIWTVRYRLILESKLDQLYTASALLIMLDFDGSRRLLDADWRLNTGLWIVDYLLSWSSWHETSAQCQLEVLPEYIEILGSLFWILFWWIFRKPTFLGIYQSDHSHCGTYQVFLSWTKYAQEITSSGREKTTCATTEPYCTPAQ